MSDKKSGKDLSKGGEGSSDLSSDLSFKDDPILLLLEVLDHTRQSGSLSLTMMDAHRRFSKVK